MDQTTDHVWEILQENRRRFVEIEFKAGETVHAFLCGAVEDMDGSRHVIYDLFWTSRPESRKDYKGCAFCDEFQEIKTVQPLSASKRDEYLAQQLKPRI